MSIEKLKAFTRQTIDQFLNSLPLEERLKGLSVEEVVKAIPPEMRQQVARELTANGSETGAPSEGQDSPAS